VSRPLPPRPHLQQLKQQAKELLASLKSGDRKALDSFHEQLSSTADLTLANAQLLLAREYGFDGWRALKTHIRNVEVFWGEGEMSPMIAAANTGDVTTWLPVCSTPRGARRSSNISWIKARQATFSQRWTWTMALVSARSGGGESITPLPRAHSVEVAQVLLDEGADIEALESGHNGTR